MEYSHWQKFSIWADDTSGWKTIGTNSPVATNQLQFNVYLEEFTMNLNWPVFLGVSSSEQVRLYESDTSPSTSSLVCTIKM